MLIQIPLSLQEKQKNKVKEKFDKCNKEKLLELCDVLDIPVAKATTRKVCPIIFVAVLATQGLVCIWDGFLYEVRR